MRGKWPRQYAWEILALEENQREKAISKVPDEFQSWVRFYIKTAEEKAEWLKKHRQNMRNRQR